MAIDHLAKVYNYVAAPFITTRELRDEETKTQSKSVGYQKFMQMKLNNELFLCAQNYGNSYGYLIDDVCEFLKNDSVVILESPASQLLTDIRILLPHSLVFGFIMFDHSISKKMLSSRGDTSEIAMRIRGLQCSIESFNIMLAREKMTLEIITPEYNAPQKTIEQIVKGVTKHLTLYT